MTWLIPLLITLAGACLSIYICNKDKDDPRAVQLDNYERVGVWILFCAAPSILAWAGWGIGAYFKFWT